MPCGKALENVKGSLRSGRAPPNGSRFRREGEPSVVGTRWLRRHVASQLCGFPPTFRFAVARTIAIAPRLVAAGGPMTECDLLRSQVELDIPNAARN